MKIALPPRLRRIDPEQPKGILIPKSNRRFRPFLDSLDFSEGSFSEMNSLKKPREYQAHIFVINGIWVTIPWNLFRISI